MCVTILPDKHVWNSYSKRSSCNIMQLHVMQHTHLVFNYLKEKKNLVFNTVWNVGICQDFTLNCSSGNKWSPVYYKSPPCCALNQLWWLHVTTAVELAADFHSGERSGSHLPGSSRSWTPAHPKWAGKCDAQLSEFVRSTRLIAEMQALPHSKGLQWLTWIYSPWSRPTIKAWNVNKNWKW